MSNQYSARSTDSSDSDSDRMRTLLDNLNNLKSKLHHFTVIDELGQPLGEIIDLILDTGHQLNLVISLSDARSAAASVLLNGRRIKKVSVQTQSVFVDITKADTQFLPEYSPSQELSSLDASAQPLPSSAEDSFPDLTFSEESSLPENAALFNGENPSEPTAADLELAQSLFTTEPDESIAIDTNSLTQDWDLSGQAPSEEDVFANWTETTDATTPSSFSFESEPASEGLANELERLDLQLDHDWSELGTASAAEDTSNSFELNLDLEPLAPASPALELTEDDLLGTESLSFGEPALDEPANPFAEALPDFSVGAASASVEELANLDWSDATSETGSTDATPTSEELPDLDWSDGTSESDSTGFTTASAAELSELDWTETTLEQGTPDFTLESEEFSLDLPAAETSHDSENALPEVNELESEPLFETSELGLEALDFSIETPSEPTELATDSLADAFAVTEERSDRWDEWADTSQVLGLEEPAPFPTSEEMSLDSLVAPDVSEPDTISSLSDLDIVADTPDLGEAAPTFDALLDQPSDQLADSSLNLEPVDFQNDVLEQPSELNETWDTVQLEEISRGNEQDELPPEPSTVNQPEGHDAWLAAAGVGAAGLAAGLASSSSNLSQVEPGENSPEEVVSTPAQLGEELDTELPLLEEQLNVEYQRRKVGEVIIRKQIETRMVQVPVRYEKLVIEQVSPERKSLAEVDLSQGALDNIELTGVNEKSTVAGEFASPAVASQALDAIAKALQNRCKSVRIEIELEDEQMQQAYQEWFDQCSQL